MTSTAGKREAILAAAQALFLKHGLRGTSMEAIARQAGVAKPTLYAYFPDKAAIFSALLAQMIATWRQDFLTALHGEGDVVRRVGAALTAKYKGLMRLVAGSSLEAAERRTELVGQLRFAVTLQDLRTVLVLRRQLAQERPRSRPWIRRPIRACRRSLGDFPSHLTGRLTRRCRFRRSGNGAASRSPRMAPGCLARRTCC